MPKKNLEQSTNKHSVDSQESGARCVREAGIYVDCVAKGKKLLLQLSRRCEKWNNGE